MRVLTVAVMLGLTACSSATSPVSVADSSSQVPPTCELAAFETPDNDIRIEGDERPVGRVAPMPTQVAAVLHRVAARLIANIDDAELKNDLTCATLFPGSYKISAPERRELFVAEIYLGFGVGFFYFVLHDPATGDVTSVPPRVYSKWQQISDHDDLLQKPFVASEDLYQDNHRQIVFEERVHNGTVYNGVVYHYFSVGPRLELTRVLALETRVFTPTDEPDDALYVRKLTRLAPLRLRLDLIAMFEDGVTEHRKIGFVILESGGSGLPFRVVERHAEDLHYLDALVTLSWDSPGDDVFLREGYTFYY